MQGQVPTSSLHFVPRFVAFVGPYTACAAGAATHVLLEERSTVPQHDNAVACGIHSTHGSGGTVIKRSARHYISGGVTVSDAA